ncbi:hypothetical protein HMI56_006323 [Coelomomyces lativittatus]|nr:hypothetical protein HMI56_006323 [Coelomomyces lativittatus]
MIMRENLPYAENRNPQYIIVRPTKKEVLPQKYEEETATKVEVSSTEKGDGNIGRKHEAVTSDTTPFINEENPYMIENNMNTHLKPDINEKREPIVSPPLVQIQSNPRLQTIEQPRSHNERGITQRNGVQPGATNSKKNEQMKSQTNSPSRDTLKNEALLKERRNAIKATWISARQTDLDKLGLGLPAKFSAASATSKPDTTRNLKKRQMGNKRFYDIAFTLGRMAEITNPRHAEQYIADVVNMLQWYYKKFYFNGFSVRLSGAHYLLQHKTLIDFQDLPKNNTNDFYLLDWNKLANKLPFQTSDQKFLFTREFKEFPLSMKGIAYKGGIGCNEKLRTGIVLISDGYVTNFYEIVRILVHEIGHVTGMAHEDEDGCGNEGKAMENKNNPFHPWKGFSRCSLEKMVCKP